jgi:hypothetical protein
MQCTVQEKWVADAIMGLDARATGLSVTVISRLRGIIRIILAAPDLGTLQNWRSLRCQQEGEVITFAIDKDWVMEAEIKFVGGEPFMNIQTLRCLSGAAA